VRLARQKIAEELRQDSKPLVGRPELEKLLRVRGDLELESRVLGQHPLPVMEVGLRLDELPQPSSRIAHQEPAALGIDVDHLRDPPGLQLREPGRERRLEPVDRRHCLEEDIAVCGRDAEHRRPPAHVGLVDLAGHVHPRADPGGRFGQPFRLRPRKS
jgi:hypothetical protein